MDWDQWVAFLSDLVGFSSKNRHNYLLVPMHGKADLSKEQGEELAETVHKRLFHSRLPTTEELRRLIRAPSNHSLPLLYLSAWIIRQQEDPHQQFWPYFHEYVVHDSLALTTLYQLAPLFTDLWRNMHQTHGIYRPQEGYSHIKWPLAHAGLTENEQEIIASILFENFGIPEKPPEILYDEPEDFLNFLRFHFQSNYHIPRRLRRLIFGPDGPALVISELAQKSLILAWPPRINHPNEYKQPKQLALPYLMINFNPLQLSVILPKGSVAGYCMIQAQFGGKEVKLETSYLYDRTYYKSYEWSISNIIWPNEIKLHTGNSELIMSVSPSSPFNKDRKSGALLFDSDSMHHVKRWRPLRRYIILLQQGYHPLWINELFVDIEQIESGKIGGVDMVALSGIGRDLITELERTQVMDLLQKVEEQLDKNRTLITLPGIDELVQPEIILCGGLPFGDGQPPCYLKNHEPSLYVRNISNDLSTLSVARCEDNGNEEVLYSVSLSREISGDSTIIKMSELDVGFYIIRYVGAPIRFNLIDQPETSILKSMITSIQLLKANSIYANDDIRHFEEKGIEISAWPFASGYLNIKTEAGSNIYPISVDSKGKRLIKAYEIGLPTNSKWVQLESTFWLARSNNLELTLRPFIPSNEWYLKDNKFYAVVRGANIGSEYKIYIIPEKPWDNQITELSGTVSSDCTIETYIPTMIGKGWFAITDNQSLQAWLLIQIGKPDTHFSKSEFINVRENSYNLPDILNLLKPINHNIRELCCFLQTVKLSKEACIPEEYDPINEKIYNIVQSEESKDIISVILCPSWDSKHATIKNINHDNGKAVLNIDGQEYLVKILIKENTVDIQWEEYSSPCICSCCQKVMTQAIWYMHQCQFPSNRGLRVLSKKLSAELFVDWLTAINLVEISVIRNISKNPSTLPKDLGYLLTQLQNAFRNKPNDVSIDPNTWVHNTFYWWKFLFNLVNGNDSKRLDWILIWGSLEVYQYSIIGLLKP